MTRKTSCLVPLNREIRQDIFQVLASESPDSTQPLRNLSGAIQHSAEDFHTSTAMAETNIFSIDAKGKA